MTIDDRLCIAALESLRDPFVLVDTRHVIRFMNEAGASNYAKWGGRELIGKSVMDCHNEGSRKIIRQIVAEMTEGLVERLIGVSEKRRTYMRAVRDAEGCLIGYYERYEYPPYSSGG